MYITESCKFLFIFSTISEGIKWLTQPGSINGCKGEDKNLTWEFDEDGKNIIQLEWYFNNKTLICISSKDADFKVKPPYLGRIEIFSKSGIKLKNVSLDDEGTYTLSVLVLWSSSQYLQSIALQVLEPPTDMCKCNTRCILQSQRIKCDFMASKCGRPKVSAILTGISTQEHLGEGEDIAINSSFYDDNVLCCPHGMAMECVNGSSQKLCTPIKTIFSDDKSQTSGNNTLQVQSQTTAPKVKESDDFITHHDKTIHILLGCIVFILLVTLSLVIAYIYGKWKYLKNLRMEILEIHKRLTQEGGFNEESSPTTVEQCTECHQVHDDNQGSVDERTCFPTQEQNIELHNLNG